MKKKSLEHHHHSIGIVILVVVAVMMVLVALSYFNPNMFFSNRNTSNEHSNLAKDNAYSSDFLNISFVVPEGFEVEDKLIIITLKNKNGEIILTRMGTNNDSLEGYLFELEDKNSFKIIEKVNISIDNLDAIMATLRSSDNKSPDKKVYYFYNNNSIFAISTDSPKLYDELDQVAQSFRYTP